MKYKKRMNTNMEQNQIKLKIKSNGISETKLTAYFTDFEAVNCKFETNHLQNV